MTKEFRKWVDGKRIEFWQEMNNDPFEDFSMPDSSADFWVRALFAEIEREVAEEDMKRGQSTPAGYVIAVGKVKHRFGIGGNK